MKQKRRIVSILLCLVLVLGMLPLSAFAAEGDIRTTNVEGTIEWVNREQQNANARPTSVTLTLYANGVATDNVITVTGSGTSWTFKFENVPALDESGNAIEYTVAQNPLTGYETTYSADTLTITNSYTAGVPRNHTFRHIDVRINGAKLEVQFVVKDANGVVISRKTETITAYVTKVESVTINGTTYAGSDFSKDGDYEYRKTRGVEIDSRDLTGSSKAVIIVDLRDADNNTYDNVSITYGLGGIMDAAYECDGYGNGRFDGLDFIVGAAQNYDIQIVSYGLEVDVQKQVKLGENAAENFSGSGGEFSFLLTEYENGEATGRTWTIRNDASGRATAMINYLYDDLEGLEGYEDRTFTYTISEINGGPDQYTYDTAVHTFTVTFTVTKTPNSSGGYDETLVPSIKETAYADGLFTFTNVIETVQVSGSKIWDDNNDQDGIRPGSIIINLLANGEVTATRTVTAGDGWAWSFEDLPKYDSNGEIITYTITEGAVEGYEASVSGYNVTNTHIPETISIPVIKTWDDNDDQDGKRPSSVTVALLADGEATGRTLILNEANNWSGSFTDLPRYRAGVMVEYTVQELEVAGYAAAITGNMTDGYTITNSHTPQKKDITVTKVWADSNDQDGMRPDAITVRLLADGVEVASAQLTAEGGWKHTFKGYDVYKDGKEIVYTVTEDKVAGYETTIDGLTITNTHEAEKTAVPVTKVWNDGENQDGIRPNHITVVLLADGKATGQTLTLSSGNNWSDSFTELPKYRAGEPIVYTVEEAAVSGYESSVTGSQEDGYTITNTHAPETVDISGSKTWVDNDNQDGARPASITINLLADGVKVDSRTVTAADDWSWSFTGLPKHKNGTAIVYSITEDAVEGYSTGYDGYNVTNTHTPEKTSLTVTKVWNDGENQDGIRPNDIVVTLLADGKATGQTLVLSSGNSWTDSFENLPKYADGAEILYTIAENAVVGYESAVTGDQRTGYTITNTHIPETVDISGSKTWVDNDNQDGVRPESITISLLADGEQVASGTVTEADGWSWSFTGLPKYKNGTAIVYTISETAVEGYTTTYDGYNVTNTYTPQQISITVTKAWADSGNQDGIRPGSVTVVLLADGVATGQTLVLDTQTGWTGSFTQLPKYANGVEIIYTIEELAVEGYSTVIAGNVTDGFVITNSRTPETVEVSGSKTWKDGGNRDGTRPESITINLLADGVKIDSRTVTEADGWSWSFTDLPRYQAEGTEIVYSITENAVEGYTTTYDGYNVTNTYTPRETSVTVTKAWADNNNQSGIRPDQVTIKLYANGVDTGKTLILSTANNWTGSFTDLPRYENGSAIKYTIGEVAVKGYNTVIRGSGESGFTVTNSHTDNPKTGDEFMLLPWLALLLLSAVMIGAMAVVLRKKVR